MNDCSICTDSWKWVATCADHTRISECGEDGSHPTFASLDKSKLVSITWVPKNPALEPVEVNEGMPDTSAVLFKRRSVEVQSDSGYSSSLPTIYCAGWEREEEGRIVGSYTFIFEDGHTFTSTDRNAV